MSVAAAPNFRLRPDPLVLISVGIRGLMTLAYQRESKRIEARSYRYDPVGRLLEARHNYKKETFAFDPASNLLDPEAPPGPNPHSPRKLIDNVLHSYCGTQYRYDERGNLQERIENGKTGKFTWDLYDRLRRYEDDRLVVEFGYDALGRRVYKDSRSKYRNRVQAGPVWNENARRALDEKLGCDLTLFIWDGDTLAFEQRGREGKGRTTHYVFEPGSFIPVAQGVINHIEEMLHQPRYAFPYDIDRDPVWQHKPTPKPFDTFGWYQCDQLGTPMEASGVRGQILWKGNYKAWGCTVEQTTIDSPEHEYNIRFQGQHFDVETGLHYNRYRYYNPAIGRFISKDPVGFLGGLNIFSFAGNPIQWIDPYDLKKKTAPSCCLAEIDPCAGDGKTHIVYQAPDPKHKDAGGNPLIYTGKASGHGSVEDVLKKRFSGGHHRKISHDDATIVFETDSYATVRGLEHLAHLDLGTLATRQNNPVGPRNPNKPTYIECAEMQLKR